MRNINLTLQYDGTNYSGWQEQKTEDRRQKTEDRKNIITIQGVIQEAIKRITGEDVNVIGAGRTDSGVHAIAQVAAFKTSTNLLPEIIKRALNANLPYDIRVTDSCKAEIGFHPRHDAKSKVYSYIICNAYDISPFLYRYAWKIPYKLNTDEMLRAAEFFKGRHDFSAFRASGCGAKNPVRTVSHISIDRLDAIGFMGMELNGNFLNIRIEADAFLRHMARNIVGTVVEVGRCRITSKAVKEIMLSKDRRLAGPTAPARGLFLEKIDY
jgi:tRNA pseudouridine38-40 synthase